MVEYQEKSSRLLLFFKWLITIPFLIIWIGYAILAYIGAFIGFWFILFSGRYPNRLVNFVYEFRIYDVLLTAYFPLLLSDDLHLLWENKAHSVTLQIDYPDKLSRLVLILKLISFLLGVATGLAGLIVFSFSSYRFQCGSPYRSVGITLGACWAGSSASSNGRSE